MTEEERAQMFMDEVRENAGLPKVKLSFDGCYNYKKLKEEGLVEEKPSDDEWIRMQTTGGGAET